MHKKEKVSVGQFAFTTSEAGNYLACFLIDGEGKGLVVKLNLEWKIGIATKDWDSVAKMEKIEVKYIEMRFYTIFCIVLSPLSVNIVSHNQGVELELVKLEASVQAIHENLLLLKFKFVHSLHFSRIMFWSFMYCLILSRIVVDAENLT
jgi:p24 family protein delta-1